MKMTPPLLSMRTNSSVYVAMLLHDMQLDYHCVLVRSIGDFAILGLIRCGMIELYDSQVCVSVCLFVCVSKR